MDEFTTDDGSAPGIGEEFDVELSASLLDDDESWETMFSGNPERRKALEHIDGWSYRAFGEVVSIGPVVVDCGMIQIPEVFHSNDARIVGEFVSFTITRLEPDRTLLGTCCKRVEEENWSHHQQRSALG